MRNRLIAVGILLVMLVIPATAADVDGTWTGTMATPNGDVPVSFTLMADGNALTGSTAGPDGAPVEIGDGMVDGDDVSFSVTFDFGGMPFTMNYAGMVMGDSIEFTIDVFGMPLELTVNRAAAAQQQGRGGVGRGGRGRGPAGPAAPANVPFHNERNDPRHETFVDIARAGDIDLLFVGDSITDWFYWPFRNGAATGGEVWEANFAPLKAADFAIAGDTTQGVLWRMQNGELDGFSAKLIVLMLGTNNINRNDNEEIVDGDRLIIEEFKKLQPQAKVLLLGIFPRTAEADAPIRTTIRQINSDLEKLADNEQVFYMDIGDEFLTPDGTLTTEIMGDGLHPTARGYQIWADAILPAVQELMN